MNLPASFKPILTLFLLISFWPDSSPTRLAANPEQLQNNNLDISGLAWVEGNTFLAVHDSKYPEEKDRPRVSLVTLPESAEGVLWKTLSIEWPGPLGPAADLESIARIPGTNSYLLVESGEGVHAGQRYLRAFLVKVGNSQVVLESYATLPDRLKNIEGSAVARIGDRLVFVCAERGDHRPRTEVFWTDLQLRPLKFGPLKSAYFQPIGFSGKDRRPISAIDADSHGRLYVASAYDPNDDNGPFRSVIWRIGRLHADRRGVRLVLRATVQKLATLDGLKVESLAIREREGKIELFAGTDDENYGSALRPIPLDSVDLTK
jgi:hypothetical protein